MMKPFQTLTKENTQEREKKGGEGPKSKQANSLNEVGHQEEKELSITNRFRTETMYVYYIAMKIYVFNCMNIFPPFYCLCKTNMPHHFPTMNFL